MKVGSLVGMLKGLEKFDIKDCGITDEILIALDGAKVVHGHWIKSDNVWE